MRKNRGFTVVEFMIVVIVIGILLGIAAPQFVKAREASRFRACASGTRMLESAKAQWAIEQGKDENATPSAADLAPFLKVWPECPSGGSYALGKVGEGTSCSVPAHAF
ncbi:MAG: prepilin-type N-terminal cleavage/methylation domain-containing protein [Fimbriimonadaceae bacterium]|nr:prepilin-type N-terminal cleavage/methylation domain-containing protein [Fimbriimonadaceae bacterium]